MSVLKLGVVAYLNMQPLVWGLEALEGLELHFGAPSTLARWLEDGRIDMGMVPVASVFAHPAWRVAGTSMIGARGPVLSVQMMGGGAPREWTHVRPDSHSMTSNALARVLLEGHMGLHPRWGEPTPPEGWEPPAAPQPGQALVAIGSRALAWRERWSPAQGGCVIDMAQAWLEATGLPFVFAVWAARPGAPLGDWPERLEAHKRLNFSRLDQVVQAWPTRQPENLTVEQATDYLARNVQFDLDAAALEGMQRFYAEGRALGLFAPGWSLQRA